MTTTLPGLGGGSIERAALLSDDGVYRYSLSRTWDDGARVLWIMLNPSTADALVDDPTIRRCMGFARRWGYGGLDVVNLFALRSPHPETLRHHAARGDDVVGPDNDRVIAEHIARSTIALAAWGSQPRIETRVATVVGMLHAHARPPLCLAVTKTGHPVHPLYQPGAAVPREWPGLPT